MNLRPRPWYREWISGAQARKQQFYDLLCKKSGRDLFDDNFFQGLEHRKSELRSLYWKLFFIELPIGIFLLITVFNTETHISILSIPNAETFREFFLFVWATLGLVMAGISAHTMQIDEMLVAMANYKARNCPQALMFLNLRYTLVPFPMLASLKEHVHYGRFFAWTNVVFIIAGIATLVILFVIVLVFQIIIMVDIYKHPSFSVSIATLTICYAVLANIVGAGIILLAFVPFPAVNVTDIHRLQYLQKTDPDRFVKIVSYVIQQMLNLVHKK